MFLLTQFVDFFVHLDTHLADILAQYGTFTYVIVFIVILCETGLVVAPLLPGDSLLFALGAFAAKDVLDIKFLLLLLTVAAIIGDSLNYMIGSLIGPKVFSENSRFFKREYLLRTHRFYERHGGKTIIIARFMPIIRTFAPFVAGVGKMHYRTFLLFNVIGGVLWVSLFLMAGYLFGNISFVEENFSLVILAVIAVSLLPPIVEWLRGKMKKRI